MATINKENDGKLPGKAGGVSKVEVSAHEVLAVRNGRERVFSRSLWDNLPADKEGYQEVSEVPKVKTLKDAPSTGTAGANAGQVLTADQEKELYTSTVEKYKEIFGEEPATDLGTADLQGLIDAKTDNVKNINVKADAKAKAKAEKDALVLEYHTLTSKKNGKTLSIEKLNAAIAEAKKGATGTAGANV